MSAIDKLAAAFLIGGAFFFFAGTVGMLRFPDTLSRLHALTKADNLGLGLIIAALALEAPSAAAALKLFVIWLVVLLASSSTCYLIAGHVRAAAKDADERD